MKTINTESSNNNISDVVITVENVLHAYQQHSPSLVRECHFSNRNGNIPGEFYKLAELQCGACIITATKNTNHHKT